MIDDATLDLYALGALDPQESARVAEAVVADPALARRLAQAEEVLAQLGASTPVDPPPSMRAAVLAALDDVPQQARDGAVGAAAGAVRAAGAVSAPDELAARRARPTRRAALRYAVAAAGAGVVAAGTWTLWRSASEQEVSVASVQDRVSSASDVQVVPASGASGAWAASELRWSPSVGEAVIVAPEPLPTPAGGVYQLWRIADEGSAPQPANAFDDAGGGVLLGGVEGARVVAVSREDAAGATTPSVPLVATYPLST